METNFNYADNCPVNCPYLLYANVSVLCFWYKIDNINGCDKPNALCNRTKYNIRRTGIRYFSMGLSFEQYKQIGDEVYPIKHYDTRFMLNDLVEKKISSKLEKTYPKNPTETNQWLDHPQNRAEFNSTEERQKLKGLPNETVVEAYISLNDLYTVDEVIKKMPEVDVTWAAIYTGIEDTMLSAEGNVVSPIGYPVQPDQTNWSPFKGSPSHEQTFLSILHFLANYEETATAVSPHKNLDLKERINYLEQHDMKTYAVVITGPKAEIEQLQNHKMIKHVKLGEVKLWNWVH